MDSIKYFLPLKEEARRADRNWENGHYQNGPDCNGMQWKAQVDKYK